jgi:hypothetical protein
MTPAAATGRSDLAGVEAQRRSPAKPTKACRNRRTSQRELHPHPSRPTRSAQMFPYAVQIAKSLPIDAVTLYSGGTESTAGEVFPSNPFSSADIDALTTGLNTATDPTPEEATLMLDVDWKAMQPNQNQQVFVLIQHSFTAQI